MKHLRNKIKCDTVVDYKIVTSGRRLTYGSKRMWGSPPLQMHQKHIYMRNNSH